MRKESKFKIFKRDGEVVGTARTDFVEDEHTTMEIVVEMDADEEQESDEGAFKRESKKLRDKKPKAP